MALLCVARVVWQIRLWHELGVDPKENGWSYRSVTKFNLGILILLWRLD